MADLSTKQRKKLDKSQFVFPGKRAFPIQDKVHARKALQMRGHKSEAKQDIIEKKVCQRYPDLDFCKKRKKNKS